jgi:hypothetical protein
MKRLLQIILPVFLAAGSPALAVEQDCLTAPGAVVNGLAVSAEASFSTDDNGTVSVTVTNWQADPLSAAQLLNGVAFTLSEGETGGSLTSDMAATRSVAAGGKFVNGAPSAMGWALAENVLGGLELCVLCTDLGAVGPKHLLIGPAASSGIYATANASLAGNKPHNPFTAGSASFFVSVPGVTSASSVTGVTFFFGTQAGISAPGACSGGITF